MNPTLAGSVRYRAPRDIVSSPAPPERPLGPREVLVAPAYIGICGTDLHTYLGHMGDRVAAGTVLGHEASGVVSAVGDDVRGWAAGDRVGVFPVISCSDCRTCRSGRKHVCPGLSIMGIDTDGAMQHGWAVPAENLVRFSDSVDLRAAGLVEPLAVAVHDVRRSRLSAGERALVIGAGPVGLLIAMVARELGSEVIIVELNEHRRVVASSLGFTALSPDELSGRSDPEEAPDVAFEVTGSDPGLQAAYEKITPGGRLVVVGIHEGPRALDLKSMFQREVEVLGARLYTRDDFEHAAALIETGRIDPGPLVSDVVAFDAVGDAFERLLAGGTDMKILVSASPDGEERLTLQP